jgi:pimeloyl-ACP methyl ester carboxylesterase
MIFEQEVLFESNGVILSGTLTLPSAEGVYPAVLMIPGSGQVDRDENARKLPINAFRQISDYLVRQGYATLRYDKRGVGASQGDYWKTGFFDNAADAAQALHFLKAHHHILSDQIFLLGHSEGAGIAAHLAGTGASAAGVILLSGWARRGEALMLWQAGQIVKGMHGVNKWLIDLLHVDVAKAEQKKLAQIKRSQGDTYRQLFVRVNAKWYREMLAYDPAEDMPNIHVPVLALTGSKDIQVDPADLQRMGELIRGDFEAHELPGITHILRLDPESPSIDHYRQLVARPVDPLVLDAISNWLLKVAVRQPFKSNGKLRQPAAYPA